MTTPETDTDPISEEELQTFRAILSPRYIAPTVEECPAIEVKHFRNRKKQWNSGGELRCVSMRSGRVTKVLGYKVIGISEARHGGNTLENIVDQPILLLVTEGVAQRIRLRACLGGFGGTRYFLECPSCQRTYRKLFLAPGKTQFACRRCEGLRYTSQRRDLDFFLKPIAAKTGVKRWLVRKYLEKVRDLLQKVQRDNLTERTTTVTACRSLVSQDRDKT